MRTAILTDIHANLPALHAVRDHVDAQGVDAWVSLGDVVGYASQPNECCALIRERARFSLLGNHDAAAVGRMELSWYHDAAREALEWTQKHLAPEHRDWLVQAPYKVRDGAVEYSHGSPIYLEEYEYVFMKVHAQYLASFRDQLAEVTFLGHAHLPRAYAIDDEGAHDVMAPVVSLTAGRQYVIAVGSVGQPRDGDPRACYGIYDDEARTFTFHRIDYPIQQAADGILAAGLDPHFAQRLFEGR